MKKIISSLLIVTLILLPIQAVAASDMEYSAPERASIDTDGKSKIEIVVSGGQDVYAGAQFELILGEGVDILGVSFDKGGTENVIPPTLARGSYFFSLYAGTNEFSGDFTCTVDIAYEGEEPSLVILAEIQRYYIERPGYVTTTTNSTRSEIAVLPYRYIDDTQLPLGNMLGYLQAHWVWIVAVFIVAFAVAAVFTSIRERLRKKKAAQVVLERQRANSALREKSPSDPAMGQAQGTVPKEDHYEPDA